MPGTFTRSWAYNGIGRLCVEGEYAEPDDGEDSVPSFWTDQAPRVGCGMDMRTGLGWCTLNGMRFDIGKW
jgi:hypothetical protein